MKYTSVVLCLFSINCLAAGAKERLDVNFPDVETGATFVLSKETPQLTLLSFWQVDCESCVRDMETLTAFAAQHSEVRMLGISLSDRKATQQIWKKQKMSFRTLVNNDFPGAVLKRFGNSVGAVPYSLMLNTKRELCWSAIGEITQDQLQQGLQACDR